MALPPPSVITSLDEALGAMRLRRGSGKGVRIGLLGTGIDESVPNVVDRVNLTQEEGDVVGHETAIARIIASIAPDVEFVDVHLLSEGKAKTSNVMKGIDAALDRKVHFLSMSLGSDETASPNEPVSQMLDDVSQRHDIISIVAAGNHGPAAGTVEAPAGAMLTFAVGSVNRNRLPSRFSARGPDGAGRIRPDIVAFGGDFDEAIGVPTVGRLGKLPGVRGTSFSVGFVTGFLAHVYDQLPSPKVHSARGVLASQPRDSFKRNDIGYGILDGAVYSEAIERMRRFGTLMFEPPY